MSPRTTEKDTVSINVLELSGLSLDWAFGLVHGKNMWIGSHRPMQVFAEKGQSSYWWVPTNGSILNHVLATYSISALTVRGGCWTAKGDIYQADGASPIEAVLRLVCLVELGSHADIPRVLLAA